jgi:hypothetical protein
MNDEAKALSENPELIECLFLVKNGIPFDVAFSLEPTERLAYAVILGELNGGRYNWQTSSFEPLKP